MPQFSLWPLRGFMNSMLRQDVPLNGFTGASLDWLLGRNRMRRRAGSVTVTNGILESKWGAKARRMVAARLKCVTDGFPTPLVLFVNETINAATLAFRKSQAGAWHQVGDGFDGTSYPATGVPTHRVVPMVYRNEYGGLTLHRLNTAEYRSHMAAGSRDILRAGGKIIWGGYDSVPTQWDGDSTVFPLGMIQPLMVPVCTLGNLTASSGATPGPWLGSQAWFFSMCYEDENGELSGLTIPRPVGSAYIGYEGFGYIQVDAANPTKYRDAMVYSGLANGPPGTRWKKLMRTTKVDVAATGAGSINQPAIGDMGFFARIPQGQTTYTDADGNDLVLDFDPRISDVWDRSAGLQWPMCARNVGRFDGHTTLACLRANPSALIVAPWANGEQNFPINDARLYGATSYFVAVTPTQIVLRSVTGGVADDTKAITITGLTLRQVVDRINSDATVTPTNHWGIWLLDYYPFSVPWIDLSTVSGVFVGDAVVGDAFATNTRIVTIGMTVGGVIYHTYCQISLGPTRASIPDGASPSGLWENVVVVHDAAVSERMWATQVVFGADADESCDSLLRTHVSTTAAWGAGDTLVNLTHIADAAFITPGMLLYDAKFNAGAGSTVQSVDAATGDVVVSHAASSIGSNPEAVVFAYDTGDTALGLAPGFVRTFGNAFPMVCMWSKAYLDRFKDMLQHAMFTAASPGYAQDGINTWMQRNKRDGPGTFDQLMGVADFGPVELQFYVHGRMRLYNPRTGLTHADEDYNKSVTSWTRGLRSPYALCAGNGWAIFLADEGFFVCDAGDGEDLLSLDIYNSEAREGLRGELEYAVKACILASDSDTDDYKISAQVHGGVLSVRYYASAASETWDREIRYDFSASVGRSGKAEVLDDNGQPFPWSCPLTIGPACSARMSQADGKVHTFVAVDGNTGATDGRVDEIDTGTTDNGATIQPIAYSGVAVAAGLMANQHRTVRATSTKPNGGITVGIARDPEVAPEDSRWDDFSLDASVMEGFGRSVVEIKGAAAKPRAGTALCVRDDGTSECPEVTMVMVDVDEVASFGRIER